ncbi:site-specific integrase [Lysinibacillus sp. B2A1]|nr:site-specific integrase [Lysinibacillus sp. B2A1]
MASVTKRGKTWQYIVSRYTDGKYDPVRKGGFSTKKEAQVAATAIEMRLQKGGNVLTRDKAFIEYFEAWIEKYKSTKHKNTYRRYQDSLRRAQEYFKDRPIQKITSDEYQTFLDNYANGRSKESVRKLNTHVKACIKDAIDDGYLAIDFTRKALNNGSVPAKKDSEKHISYAESQRLLKYLINHLESTEDYLLLLGLVSGMRFGELVGLTKNAFNFKENIISIVQAWDYRGGTGYTDLKNTPSERTIVIEDIVMRLLEDYANQLVDNDFGLFFYVGGNIKSVTNEDANKRLKSILNKLGIQAITCHGLRHTHASVLLYEGVDTQYVSERLGHETIFTTMHTYAHVLRELRTREEQKAMSIYKKMLDIKDE